MEKLRMGDLARAGLMGVLATSLAACVQSDMSDLEQHVAQIKARPGGRIEPLPQAQPYESYAYSVQDERSPFEPDRPQVAVDDQAAEGDGIQPDFDRNREPLEEYPLDTLRMRGTVSIGGEHYGLVETPDDGVYRVQVDNYMGENHGRITAINELEITLVEIVPDGLGGWMERDAALAIGE